MAESIPNSANISKTVRLESEGANIIPYNSSVEPAVGSLGAYLNLRTMFKTRAIAQSTLIASSVDLIEAMNYDNNKVEGSRALYRRVNAEPAHPGKIQTAGGQWWEIAEPFLCPEMFGAFGFDDIAKIIDDTYGVQNAIDCYAATRKPIHCKTATYLIDGYKGARPTWTASIWAHGGLPITDGLEITGAGVGKTIFKNATSNWRSIFRGRSGRIVLRDLTVDGDIDNFPMLPDASPTNEFQGSVVGTPIIFEGGAATAANPLEVDLQNLEVKNSGGYGIGFQNVFVSRAYINNILFKNIGDDGIDIKWLTSPDYYKHLQISNLHFPDGCGHHPDTDKPACVDIGGHCHVSNVFISDLNSNKWAAGVRLRAKVAPERSNAEGSTVKGVYVKSSKTAGTGSETGNAPHGVVINSEDVSVSDVYVDGCFKGVYLAEASGSTPTRVNLSNVIVRNCNGESGSGSFGVGTDSDSRQNNFANIIVNNCDVGLYHRGARAFFANISLRDNVVGLDIDQIALENSDISGIDYATNGANNIGSYLGTGVNYNLHRGEALTTGKRQLWRNIFATADDGAWSGDDAWMGGDNFWSADTSGSGPGLKARVGLRATGGTGSGFDWVAQILGSDVLSLKTDQVKCKKALVIPVIEPASAPTPDASSSTLFFDGGILKSKNSAGVVTGLQYASDNLTAIAGLTTAADKLTYWNGSGTAALADFSAFGRSLVDDADVAAARTTLGLGTAATLNTGTSGATIPRNDSSNTFSQNQTAPTFTANTNTGGFSLFFSKHANADRWAIGKDSVTETGSNAGSNYVLRRYDDSGALIGNALNITRSNGDIAVGGKVQPSADNTYTLGGASNRWSVVYAGTGTINTSDERDKNWLRSGLTDAELRAGRRIMAELGTYQWLDAIAEKGEDAARWHFGVRAQQVFAILEDEGLDWRRYAWCCYDEWEAVDAVMEPVMAKRKVEREREIFVPTGEVDEKTGTPLMIATTEKYEDEEEYDTGEVQEVMPARKAGDRYGLRVDQLALFLIAVNNARLEALEAS